MCWSLPQGRCKTTWPYFWKQCIEQHMHIANHNRTEVELSTVHAGETDTITRAVSRHTPSICSAYHWTATFWRSTICSDPGVEAMMKTSAFSSDWWTVNRSVAATAPKMVVFTSADLHRQNHHNLQLNRGTYPCNVSLEAKSVTKSSKSGKQ